MGTSGLYREEFLKRKRFDLEWKSEKVMDGESGEDEGGKGIKMMNQEETDEDVADEMSQGSWFQRWGDAYDWKE